jgi:hypothetical protein
MLPEKTTEKQPGKEFTASRGKNQSIKKKKFLIEQNLLFKILID